MKLKLFILFSLLSTVVLCQTNSRMNIDFVIDESLLANPLTGGYDSPQFNEIDLNLDGIKDLVVFDRKGSAIRTYLFNPDIPGQFEYRPEFEAAFPSIGCWVKVLDYDGDGIDDLFTCGVTDPITGIEVWKGTNDNGKIGFQAYNHDKGPYNIIYYKSGFDYKQLYVGNNGFPAIGDIDGDGDIDILAFQPAGGYMYYFKNISVESGWDRDSLEFIREEDCWGYFYEGGLVPDIYLSEDGESCAPPAKVSAEVRHEGITATMFDAENDGDQDLLIGEVSGNQIIFVQNGGTNESAFADFKENGWPMNDVPVDMPIFLGSYKVDANRDGLLDLIFAPNSQFGQNVNQAHMYQRKFNNGVTNYEFIQDDWIVGESLDFGSDSHPAFADINGDGLQDILIGSYGIIDGFNTIETRIFYFENTGSSNNPKYELKDDNFLNFLQFSEFDKSYSIDFGDLDSDGDEDILMGTLNGEIVFVENRAGAGMPMEFEDPVFDYFELNSENNTLKVTIGDVNEDGMNDIIVAGRNSYTIENGIGSLKAFINVGTTGEPSFNNETVINGYGQINVKDAGTSRSSACPRLIKINNENYIIVGNELGRIAFYKEVENGYELLIEEVLNERLGRKATVDISDIDDDGYFELIIGNERGGINMYDTKIQTDGTITASKEIIDKGVKLYPNPALGYLNIEGISINFKYTIFDLLGKVVSKGESFDTTIDLNNISDGTYMLQIYSKNHYQTFKFIKLNPGR